MKKLTRRSFLGSSAAVGAGIALHSSSGRGLAQSELPWTPIGFTQAGEPLVVYHLGNSASRILLLGGQHGGPEANTIQLVRQLVSYFTSYGDELPSSLGIDFMPNANPDGTRAGIRQFLSGVDPNRNWPSAEWRSDAYDSNGVLRLGLGGPAPFSEQETRATADWLLQSRPLLVVNYHSAGGFMFGGRDGRAGELADAYAGASGYWRPVPGAGSSPLSYRATGSMNVWMREVGIDGLFIELTTPSDPELSRNLAGLRAVLARLA